MQLGCSVIKILGDAAVAQKAPHLAERETALKEQNPHPGAATADISAFAPRASLPFDSNVPGDDPSKPR